MRCKRTLKPLLAIALFTPAVAILASAEAEVGTQQTNDTALGERRAVGLTMRRHRCQLLLAPLAIRVERRQYHRWRLSVTFGRRRPRVEALGRIETHSTDAAS